MGKGAALGVPASQACIFMHLVESSNLHAIGYDGGSETLYVEFRNDTRYRYLQVPHPVYLSFLHAPSHGQCLNQRIKPDYQYQRVV